VEQVSIAWSRFQFLRRWKDLHRCSPNAQSNQVFCHCQKAWRQCQPSSACAHALHSANMWLCLWPSLNLATCSWVFVKPCGKNDDDNYWDELLMELVPAIWSIADKVYIFQQDNAPARLARQTVELLHCETLEFHCSWHVATQHSPVDYRRNESITRHHRTCPISCISLWV